MYRKHFWCGHLNHTRKAGPDRLCYRDLESIAMRVIGTSNGMDGKSLRSSSAVRCQMWYAHCEPDGPHAVLVSAVMWYVHIHYWHLADKQKVTFISGKSPLHF